MKKNRKLLIISFCIILYFVLLIVVYIKENKLDQNDDIVNGEYLNFEVASFEGDMPTDENPYGILAGKVEEQILLTPGTSVSFDVNESTIVAFEYKIDDQVAENSDGAGLVVQFIASSGDVIHEEMVEIDNDSRWESFSSEFVLGKDCAKVRIACNNGKNNDGICDWVLMKPILAATNANKELDYWISAHYFADRWPKNFWDSELEDLDEDFARIKEDGFNSIILVVPWREFQPQIKGEIVYKESAFEKLNKIIMVAREYDLGVVLRVGYVWDFHQGEDFTELNSRYREIIYDTGVRKAWLEYCETLYNRVSVHDNYWGSFICWEDFWGMKYDAEYIGGKSQESLTFANQCGYSKYMMQNYTLEEIRAILGDKQIESIEDIYVPAIESGCFSTFLDFYDQKLNQLLEETQSVFPEISMEVRVDDDLVINDKKEHEYYSHKATYPCEQAAYTTIVYGIPMGFANQGERVSAKEALKMTEKIFEKVKSDNNEKKLYVDQFLFYDNAPQFSYNAQVKEDELNEYLVSSADVLREYCRGYGIWTYKNYTHDSVANGEFANELQSWVKKGDVEIIEVENSNKCFIKAGSEISQDVAIRGRTVGTNKVVCSLEVIPADKKTQIVISLNDMKKTIEICEAGEYKLEFPGSESEGFSISVQSGDAYIDNVKLYDFEQDGMLYGTEWEEKKAIESMRSLNHKLIEQVN